MTSAEAKRLRALKGQPVKIDWWNPNHDWPYFRLLKINAEDCTIKLRGMYFPDGSATHDGGKFWVDWRDVKCIAPVM